MKTPVKFSSVASLLAEIETQYDSAKDETVKFQHLDRACGLLHAVYSVEGAIASARDAFYAAKEHAIRSASALEETNKIMSDFSEKYFKKLDNKEA